MLQIGTKRGGRAGECWGLGHAYSDFWPRHEGWASLDADDYIFPHREIETDDLASRTALLAHCRDALCASVARTLPTAGDRGAQRLVTAALLTSIDIDTALRIGRATSADWYAAAAGKADAVSSTALEAVGVLDDLHARLSRGEALPYDTLALTRIAFHAGFNPVVICPDAIGDAELLTVAAWLGVVHRGRQAIMPRFVAAYWQMLLGNATSWPLSSYGPDAFLMDQAAALFPFDAFRASLVRAMSSGPTAVAAPRPPAPSLAFLRALPFLGALAASAGPFFTSPAQSSRGAH